ncbi:MAG: nucleotide sugar dehydrogenase, partial [Gammaproteobacteria bacterium]|nr:nucleotide sugar dehydrogenase [Gammaproteobacteria bacterium]
FLGISLCKWESLKDLGALILAVPHQEYLDKSIDDFTGTLSSNGCLIDVKSVLDVKEIRAKGVTLWRL